MQSKLTIQYNKSRPMREFTYPTAERRGKSESFDPPGQPAETYEGTTGVEVDVRRIP